MLGGRDPVGVDRLDVVGVGLAAPADQEALGDRASPCRPRAAGPAGGRRRARTGRRSDSAITEARARSSRASLVGDVDQRLEAPLRRRASRARPGRRRAGRRSGSRSGCGSAGGRPGLERAVDEQAPDLLERHVADELLDVDAAVAERAALPVGLGDLGGEGDDALEAGLDSSLMRREGSQVGRGSGASPDARRARVTLGWRPRMTRPHVHAASASSPPTCAGGELRAREVVDGGARAHRGARRRAQRVRRGRRRARAGRRRRDRARRRAPVRGRADRDQGQHAGRPACR